MYSIISHNKYSTVRKILKGSSLEFAEEFLLLITKCNTLKKHDISIIQSLTAVEHPSISIKSKHESTEHSEIWISQEG